MNCHDEPSYQRQSAVRVQCFRPMANLELCQYVGPFLIRMHAYATRSNLLY